jgi:hypothetical protein
MKAELKIYGDRDILRNLMQVISGNFEFKKLVLSPEFGPVTVVGQDCDENIYDPARERKELKEGADKYLSELESVVA